MQAPPLRQPRGRVRALPPRPPPRARRRARPGRRRQQRRGLREQQLRRLAPGAPARAPSRAAAPARARARPRRGKGRGGVPALRLAVRAAPALRRLRVRDLLFLVRVPPAPAEPPLLPHAAGRTGRGRLSRQRRARRGGDRRRQEEAGRAEAVLPVSDLRRRQAARTGSRGRQDEGASPAVHLVALGDHPPRQAETFRLTRGRVLPGAAAGAAGRGA